MSKAGFTQKDAEDLTEEIRNTASLTIYIRRLENIRDELLNREILHLKKLRY